MTQKQKTIAIFVVIIVLLGAGIAYTKYTEKPLSTGNTSNTASTTTNSNSNDTGGISGIPEGATVTVTDKLNADLFYKTPQPSLDRALPQGPLPKDAYAALKTQRERAVALIKETPASMQNWLALGILHQQVNDFEGARIYWNYVATVNPENTTVHYNLANLYANYIHDSAKAEAEFKKVISTDPKNGMGYISYSEFLTNLNKKDQALTVLDSGIKASPENIDLDVAKAHLLRDMGKKVEARAAYDAAIKKANDAKNSSLVGALTEEKNAL